MAKTVVGLFHDFDVAQQVVQELENRGFNRDDISLMSRDQSRYKTGEGTSDRGTHAGTGAAAGAGTGAAVGGIAGLLVGLGVLAIPGIGPILAAGPIATTLAGMGVGAAAGGIVGALTGAGVPKEEAHAYAEGVRRGGTLVMVRASDDMADTATSLMNRFHPIDIHDESRSWREGSNWQGFNETSQPYSDEEMLRQRETWRSRTGTGTGYSQGTTSGTSAGRGYTGMRRDFNDYAADFRNDYNSYYSNRGRDYSYYEPGYRYGYDLANDPNYRGRNWSDIEPQVRRDWERSHPNNAWDDFKDSIRNAWERVTSG